MEKLTSFFINFFSKGWKESLNQYKSAKFSMDSANLDEMVFEDRNKDYGAYILRKNHNWYLATAVAFVSSVFLYVCFLPVYLGWMKEKKAADNNISICCCIINEPLPEPIKYFYPPQADQIQSGKTKKIRTVSFHIPVPAPAKEISWEGKGKDRVNSITDASENTDPKIAPDTIAKKLKPPVWQGLPNPEISTGEEAGCWCGEIEGLDNQSRVIEFPDSSEFVVVDEEPVPINMDELVKLMKFPNHWCYQGSFVFRVLVDKKGNYVRHIDFTPNHPAHSNHSEPFEKVIPRLKFTPAIQGGKPIPFWVNLPFNIKLLN